VSLLSSLLIVAGTLAAAAIFAVAYGKADRERLLLEIVIGVASTFAGVFLGLGLDNLKRTLEDRDLAVASLRSSTVSFIQQMRPWYQDAQKFPTIALTTPDADQKRIFLETFQDYLSKAVLEAPSIMGLSDPRITKSFDEIFLILLSDYGTRIKIDSRIVNAATAQPIEKYRNYHQILQLGNQIYELMCLQESLLRGDASQVDFDTFLQGNLGADRANQLKCSSPPWDAPNLVNTILQQASRAGAKSIEPKEWNAGP
jgi:hypothetical protein